MKYNLIYADPPWQYGSKQYQDNGRDFDPLKRQYDTMSIDEIKLLPIKDIIDTDCACFLWVTDSHLKEGIEVLEAWGFKYKTVGFNWIKKTNKGNTFVNFAPWTLKSSELCLLGIKGTMGKYKKVNNIRQLVEAVRTTHSSKPQEVIGRIEALFGDIPRLELFCRQPRLNWSVWGNEIAESIELRS